MTVSLCLWCGETKVGAMNDCMSCGRLPVEYQVSVQFTDHYLTSLELETLGGAVKVVSDLRLSDEEHVYSFLYFVSRNWPKILDMDLEGLPPSIAHVAEGVYRSHFADWPTQQESSREATPWELDSWLRASTPSMAEEELVWSSEVRFLIDRTSGISEKLVSFGRELGLGGFWGGFRLRRLAGAEPSWTSRVELLRGEVAETRRQITRSNNQVRNGWSRRAQERAKYMNGVAGLLEELVELADSAARHGEGAGRLIPLDQKRLRQDWAATRRRLKATESVVRNPNLMEDPVKGSVH